ncbi:nucleotidyltransferase domain-containing protein [Candidatus Woesearchaeota archaeon]|nr:nucleotidyltransferase domain-containing protein [Candidatus Woesearchaeota archaeon]
MKLSEEEKLRIFDLFRKNLFSEFTINDIMKKLKKRSYSWMYNALMNLKPFFNTKQTGKIYSFSINLNNPGTIAVLTYLDKKEALNINVPIVDKIINSISKKSIFFTLLVTGSYATSTNRKDSDIDLIVIVNKEDSKKEIKPYITEITRLEPIEVDLHLFTKEEYYTMLINDQENFGKESFRKHLLFYGVDAYYQIIKEAMKNGLSTKI